MKTGKSAKTALIYVVALSLLLGTAVFIQFQASATIVTADLEIEPDRVDLGAEIPGNFKFYLTFSGKYKKYKVADINTSTIMIEGLPYPVKDVPGQWRIKDNTVKFRVKGEWLVDYVIWPKIYHMARTDPQPEQGKWFPYKIDITVTGSFKEDSPFAGTEFSGTDTIHVYVPQDEPNPPPPPPG